MPLTSLTSYTVAGSQDRILSRKFLLGVKLSMNCVGGARTEHEDLQRVHEVMYNQPISYF